MESFKNRLSIAMKEKHMTQARLADITKIAQGTISNYSVGKYAPKGKNLSTIAEALNVSEAWLAGYDVPRDFNSLSVDDQLADLEKDPADQNPFYGHMEYLTDEEFSILNAYRKADPNIQNAIKLMLNV